MTNGIQIGFDLRPLQLRHRFRGVGVYLENLLTALAQIDHVNEYVFFAYEGPHPLDRIEPPSAFRFRVRRMGRAPAHMLTRNLREAASDPLGGVTRDLDVVFLPDPAAAMPKGRVPVVAVVYDLIPLLYRDRYFPRSFLRLVGESGPKAAMGNRMARVLYRRQLSRLRSAARLVAISEATRRDLVNRLGLPAELIEVIYLAGALEPGNADASIPAQHGLTEPYVAYLGGNDFRKNVPALIEAFEQLRDEVPAQLALIGRDFDRTLGGAEFATVDEFLRSSRHRSSIRCLGFMSNTEVASILRQARLFVFPSLYEGFGIPVLDAMACGCPVVALRNSSIPEVAGDAAVLVEREEQLADVVRRLWDDEGWRQELSRRGLARASQFSWSLTARKTVRTLEDVAARSRTRR